MSPTKRKGWITAEEHQKQLDADPAYRDRMDEKEANRLRMVEASKKAAEPMFHELRSIGVGASSLSDLENKYMPISKEVVGILLKWLPMIDAINIQMGVLSILRNSKYSFDGRPLTELFEASKNSHHDGLRWSIAETVAFSKATGIEKWVKKILLNKKYLGSRQMLCYAVGKMFVADEAISILKEVFDGFPMCAADALSKIADRSVVEFLTAKRCEY